MEQQFTDIIQLIQQSRVKAIKTVNTELINLYWNVGAYIHKQLSNADWGEKTVDELAAFIQKNHPELKGFNRRGLYRMKQFYETYAFSPIVSPLVTQLQSTENQYNTIVSPVVTQFKKQDIYESILVQLSWTHHLIIMSRCKSQEEREFYLRLCIQEGYGKRELERQINSGVFERTMIGNTKLSALTREIHPDIANAFKDSYVFDFLNLPEPCTKGTNQTNEKFHPGIRPGFFVYRRRISNSGRQQRFLYRPAFLPSGFTMPDSV